MRERAAHCAVNLSSSQQKHSVFIETQVRQELSSALCPCVNVSYSKVHQKLKSRATLGRRDVLEEGQRKTLRNASEIRGFTRSCVNINRRAKVRKTHVDCRVS